jgi:hypothetical protein
MALMSPYVEPANDTVLGGIVSPVFGRKIRNKFQLDASNFSPFHCLHIRKVCFLMDFTELMCASMALNTTQKVRKQAKKDREFGR